MSPEDFGNELKIRRMIEGDLISVKYLESACGLSYWSIEDYRDLLNNKDYIAFVAQFSDKIIGFIVARLITIEDEQSKLEKHRIMCEFEIFNIGVDKNFRKKGIGRRLLDSCFNTLEAQDKIICQLDVRKSNEAAIRFYKREGFTVGGIRKNFYNNPSEDALYMFSEKIINHKNLI